MKRVLVKAGRQEASAASRLQRNRRCATGRTRLRPILITTTAIIAGLVPTSLGIGIGGTGRAAFAVTIPGGQSLRLFLTRLLVPVACVRHRNPDRSERHAADG